MKSSFAESTGANGFGYRHLVAVIMLLYGVVSGFFNSCLSVGVVGMNTQSNPNFKKLNWTTAQINFVVMGSSIGGLIGSLPVGYYGRISDVKSFTLLTTIPSVLLFALMPVAVNWGGWECMLVMEFVQSLITSATYPPTYTFMAKWTPKNETSTMLGIFNLGFPLGGFLTLYASGLLAASTGGWPSIFYAATVCGLAWCVIFSIFCTNSPEENKFMSQKERDYILMNRDTSDAEVPPVPWKTILRSKVVLALLIIESTKSLGDFFYIAEQPLWESKTFNLPIAEDGLIAGLPQIFLAMLIPLFGWLCDYVTHRGRLSRTTVVKLFTLGGCIFSAVLLVIIGTLKSIELEENLSLILVGLANVSTALFTAGYHSTHVNIAPNYAGFLFGLTCLGQNITIVIAPYVVGLEVSSDGKHGWSVFFIEIGTVMIIGVIIYLMYGSAELQSWNNLTQDMSLIPEPSAVIQSTAEEMNRYHTRQNGTIEPNNMRCRIYVIEVGGHTN